MTYIFQRTVCIIVLILNSDWMKCVFYISTGELELLMHYLTSKSFAHIFILIYYILQYSIAVASCFLCSDYVFESAENKNLEVVFWSIWFPSLTI